MTPAKRRRIIHGVILAAVIVIICLLNNLVFLYQGLPWDQKLAAILMGRRPGSAKPGTLLVRLLPPKTPPGKPPTDPRQWAAMRRETPPPPRPTHISFDALGKWKFVEGKTPVPDSVKQLDGKLVQINGLMLPGNKVNGLDRFILVQSLWGCCFGQVPAPNHIVAVTMKSDRVVEFCPDPVKVTGTFSVGETREKGALVSVYRMEAENVVVR